MNLVKATATVGGMTLISRVLGFVRDVLMAGLLGTGPVADAFAVAFRFPNLFRRFFAEGAFNAAFVPLFAKRMEAEGGEAARAFADEAMSGLVTVLLTLTALALVFMPALMVLMAPGFLFEPGEEVSLIGAAERLAQGTWPEKFGLAVHFTRIAFPYLLFVSLVALLSGILNSTGRFALAAAAPVLLNIILISAMLFVAPHTPTPGHALVWGVAFAGIAQFLVLVWACARVGLLPRLRVPRLTPGVKRLVALGIPGILAGGITQINLVIGQIIASLEDGAIAILYYADRLYQLPLGLVGVAMGVVLLPDLSRRLRGGNEEGALWAQNRAFELSMLLTLPAAVALAVVGLPIIRVLIEGIAGEVFATSRFTAEDSVNTARALAAFAWGLPAFVLIKVLQPGFFAREDTRTPMYYAGAQTIVNVGLSLFLFFRIGFVGIAIATSVGAWANALLLGMTLWRRGYMKTDPRLRRRLPRIGLASLLMGVALAGLHRLLMPWFDDGLAMQVTALAVLVLGGMAVFGLCIQVTGGGRIQDLRAALRRP
ncbi:MAG: murein biosynthesis integral membrane protein MurJ [Alphaproteobacteria bacterium]